MNLGDLSPIPEKCPSCFAPASLSVYQQVCTVCWGKYNSLSEDDEMVELEYHLLFRWPRERVERFALHLLGDEAQEWWSKRHANSEHLEFRELDYMYPPLNISVTTSSKIINSALGRLRIAKTLISSAIRVIFGKSQWSMGNTVTGATSNMDSFARTEVGEQ